MNQATSRSTRQFYICCIMCIVLQNKTLNIKFYRICRINKPWWIQYGVYDLTDWLLLAPVFRLFFCISVKTINIDVVKTFNIHENALFNSDEEIYPFKDNIQGVNVKHFGTNQVWYSTCFHVYIFVLYLLECVVFYYLNCLYLCFE